MHTTCNSNYKSLLYNSNRFEIEYFSFKIPNHLKIKLHNEKRITLMLEIFFKCLETLYGIITYFVQYMNIERKVLL